MRGQPRDVNAVEHHTPGERLVCPRDGSQQRRLAGPVGADQSDDLALRDLE